MDTNKRYLPLIENWIYFGHLDLYRIIPSYPESISDSMSSTFETANALSRSAPVFTYSHSGPRTVTIQLQLHREMMDATNVNISNLKSNVLNNFYKDEDYVDALIRNLQACSVPKYTVYASGAKAVEPPWVALKFGESVFIKGVIRGNITVEYQKPILKDNKYAIVNISFTVSEIDPYDADTIANQGSFRGITRTMKSGPRRG